MAATYSIVLNLSGNALSATARIAQNLERANVAATALAANLRAVGAAARTIPATSLRNASTAATRTSAVTQAAQARAMQRGSFLTRPTAYVAGSPGLMLMRQGLLDASARNNIGHAAARGINMQTAPSPRSYTPSGFYARRERAYRNPAGSNSGSRYRQARDNRIFRYGSGGRIGGISWQGSRIFTPDANGQIMGINANTFFRSLNIGSIVMSLGASIGKTLLKVVAATSLAPYVVGGMGLKAALGYMESESFAGGVRLIARRRQAQLGLGENYERANNMSDFISSAYGLDRSTTLSSINVLTGLGIGGTNRKIDIAQAGALTKVGGIISQTNGVPFERIMTNIQQLLVQQTPNMRDIRELLNQAPILGKYALREMEAKGVTGVDVRTYLKDQNALLSVLKSYELDTATNAGMQARGQISLARQDFHALIAGNDKFWGYMGNAGAQFYQSAGKFINNMLTTLSTDNNFKNMIEKLSTTLDAFANNVDRWLPIINEYIMELSQRYGYGDDSTAEAIDKTARRTSLEDYMRSNTFRQTWMPQLEADDLFKDLSKDKYGRRNPDDVERVYQEWLRGAITNTLSYTPVTHLVNGETITGEPLIKSGVLGVGEKLLLGASDLKMYPVNPDGSGETLPPDKVNRRRIESSVAAAYTMAADTNNYVYFPHVAKEQRIETNTGGTYTMPLTGRDTTSTAAWLPKSGKTNSLMINPDVSYGAYTVLKNRVDAAVRDYNEQINAVSKIDPAIAGAGNGETGEDISGANKDRRALEIHFHDKLVEWNSTFSSNDPEETVQVVARDIELITSAAIQKALLGASNKMGSHWY